MRVMNGAYVRPSSQERYALLAALRLAERYGENPLSVSHIASGERLSPAFLEQVLHRLKKSGWIKSIRGPRGGYVLTRPPSQVSVDDILMALGEEARGLPESVRKDAGGTAPKATAFFWESATEEIRGFFKRKTLADLLAELERRPGAAGTHTFQI